MLRAYADSNGYPWTVTLGEREVLESYGVTSMATKFAVDRQGVIAFERGYGVLDASGWEGVLEDLVQR